MFSLLSRLFAPFGPPKEQESSLNAQIEKSLAEVYDPTNENDRVGLALLVTIDQQLDLLGLKSGAVPFDDRFGSNKCRGALLGIGLAILESEVSSPSPQAIADCSSAAFSLVYGQNIGPQLAQQATQDIASGNPEMEAAFNWAFEDTKGVYSSGGTTSVVGFYVAANQMI